MVYIFVTGGVVSSLGKGILSGSLGALLESSGFSVTCVKLDPYLNVDPGTISPSEHGEVYVTADGAETDLDLGHYERYVSTTMQRENSITSGQVYGEVIKKERQGDYLGATVQVIPHITDHIQNSLEKVAKSFDITLVEVGGTVGDIESLPFLEAIRQMRIRHGMQNVMYIHLTLLPYISTAGELKTKPTQHSVKELRSIGIQPDILVCRSDREILGTEKTKIGLFTNVRPDQVISLPDVDTTYRVPQVLAEQSLLDLVCKHTGLSLNVPNMLPWEDLVARELAATKPLEITMVGKYSGVGDAYKSLREAIRHASIALGVKTVIRFIDAETTHSADIAKMISSSSGLIVPGGFGQRGSDGKITAIQAAREHKVPFLGICFGMQLAVIEFCKHVLRLDAGSTEIDAKIKDPVVCLIDELQEQQGNSLNIGGTMRLGAMEDVLTEGSVIEEVYQTSVISERHRHRYEVNPKYAAVMQKHGLVISGRSVKEDFIDVVEIPGHPWFIGCQFHPEFSSRPLNPHPLFKSFLQASLVKKG